MKILYVEDDARDADLTCRELARLVPHLKLETAATLAEARLRLAAQANYDLALVDLRLPDGSGLDLLAEIREQELPMAVVILTGSGDEENAVAALKAGADDYLAKRGDYLARLPLTLETALARFRVEVGRRAGKLRVLYVEHHAADVDLTRRHLARYAPHIRLEVVHRADAVLKCLSAHAAAPCPYEVLLLDYRLPGLNALELLKILRDERRLDLPVVLVTGQGDEEAAVQAMRLGATYYLTKHPNYLYELPAALENAYHQAQLARERTALRASEARFRRLAENAQDLIYRYEFEPQRGFTYVSPAAAAITGYTPEEHYADPDLGFKLVHPDDRPLLAAAARGEVSADHPLTLRWVRKDGAVIWTEQRNTPVNNEAGRLIALEGIARDITERKQAEVALQASLQQKTQLIQELYHRTKNNMQVVMSMLMLQAGYTDNKKVQGLLQESASRIQSMALVHEKLYQSQDLSSINLAEYIDDLAQLLSQTYQVTSNRITVVAETEPVRALIDIAVPCGLILNELLANALEHAFPDGRAGEIRIGLRRLGPGELMLEVADNGVGLPAGFDVRQAGAFGLQTIVAIVEYQLQGTVAFESKAGVTWRIRFRDDLYRERV